MNCCTILVIHVIVSFEFPIRLTSHMQYRRNVRNTQIYTIWMKVFNTKASWCFNMFASHTG